MTHIARLYEVFKPIPSNWQSNETKRTHCWVYISLFIKPYLVYLSCELTTPICTYNSVDSSPITDYVIEHESVQQVKIAPQQSQLSTLDECFQIYTKDERVGVRLLTINFFIHSML